MMIVTVVYRRHLYTALGLLLMLTASGLAVEQAYAQEQPQNLFSAIPDDTDNTPPSLDARSSYLTASEMAILNVDVLQSDSSLNVTMFGNTYTISKDLVEMRGDGDYTWFGSGDQMSNAIFVVNGTHASGLIYTATKTFEILHVSGSIHEIYDLDMSQFPTVSSGQTNTARAAQDTPDRDLISQLESAYIGWQEYDTGPGGYTLQSELTNGFGKGHVHVGGESTHYSNTMDSRSSNLQYYDTPWRNWADSILQETHSYYDIDECTSRSFEFGSDDPSC